MTVTISRLYDDHNDAQQAVRRLEAAGVPHSDISIVANNSDSWFNSEKKVDRDRDGVDDRAEGAGKAAESEAKRPPIPTEGGHRFRSKAATRSGRRRPPC